MSEEYLIKKYSSRRLYDVRESCFITLSDLNDIIRRGHDIKVLDGKKRDITRSVLLQVIAEQEHAGEPLLSTDMLHEIIRLYGSVMQGPFGRYLEEGVWLLRKQRKALQETVPHAFRNAATSAVGRFVEQQNAFLKQSQDAFFSLLGADEPAGSKSRPKADDNE